MNPNENKWKQVNQATWKPFLTLLCFLPFLDTKASDPKAILIEVLLLLIPATVLFITTQSIRNRVNQIQQQGPQNN